MSDWQSDKHPEWGVSKNTNRFRRAGETPPAAGGRDWKLIEKLVMSLQSEQRKQRRWGIFFKLLTFGYLFALLFLFKFSGSTGLDPATTGEHTAVINVEGLIAADQEASADNIVGALRDAFESESAKGVVLRINSGGGSPVQSGYVYDEIRRLRELHPEKRVYAVISDIGASGAYYIASAADEIYADKASLVGSIGVVAGGFGFTGAMDKLGVDRRLYTSGENKAFLDPFSPEKPEEVEFWQNVLDTTHQQFINAVKQGRGDRLDTSTDKLFSGFIWSGQQAKEIGLIDGFGSTSYVAREIVGQEEMVDYSHQESPFKELVDQLGVAVGEGIGHMMVESRFQLR